MPRSLLDQSEQPAAVDRIRAFLTESGGASTLRSVMIDLRAHGFADVTLSELTPLIASQMPDVEVLDGGRVQLVS